MLDKSIPMVEQECTSRQANVPVISVVIPAYNRGDKLLRSVASVFAQTFEAYEIIIVDDASTMDPIASLGDAATNPKVRVIRHEKNRGASAARNTGVRAARGRFVAFLDSDDEWDSAKLAVQYEAACGTSNPDRVFCVVQSTLLRSEERSEVRPSRGVVQGEAFDEYLYVYGGLTQTSSFMVARPLALDYPFREDLPQYEDHLFFIESCQAGADYVFVARPLSVYHAEHSDGRLSSENDIEKCRAYLQVAKPYLSRKSQYAFEVRYLARLLVVDRPLVALSLFARALAAGALRPRFALSFFLRLVRLRS